jgi:hypothetical protein
MKSYNLVLKWGVTMKFFWLQRLTSYLKSTYILERTYKLKELYRKRSKDGGLEVSTISQLLSS